ncbi:MAG: hypothetical protein J6M24_00540 [Lachnospiraceae bacterium]|nr:hypothetical protein [Lachnospiraceae bacterium]
MKDKKNTEKKEELVEKLEKHSKSFIYRFNLIAPYIFTAGAIIFSLLYMTMKRKSANGDWSTELENVGLTTLFDGNPNIIAIIGVLCMIPCLLIVPKSMLKERKNGDGLGLMFMPLGLLGIFDVMCTIENVKDTAIGIIFGVALFLISALATFRKTIKYVPVLCGIMIIVAIYNMIAKFMPYCFIATEKVVVSLNYDYVEVRNYYLSYFIRDILIFAGFGSFSARIAAKYKEIDAEKSKDKKKR